MRSSLMRRRLAGMIGGFAIVALGAFALPALAQQFPTQTIKLLVAFPPGGGADAAARILATGLAEQTGQSVVVENVSGAGGTIGTARAAHAAADGYTLLVGTPSTHGSNVAVYSSLDYDPVKDFAPVMLIGTSPFMLLTSAAFEAKSVQELIAIAKANRARSTTLRTATAASTISPGSSSHRWPISTSRTCRIAAARRQ